MPRLAANITTLFPEVPFPERFALAAQAGFAAVEMQFPYDWPAAELARAAAAAGLEVLLVNAPRGDEALGELGQAALPQRQEAFRDNFARALDYAEAFGAGFIHVMAGLVPQDADRAAAQAVYIENLSWAAPLAKAAGRRVLIEPINRLDNPGYFLSDIDQARAVLEAVGSDSLAVQYDFYHTARMGRDPAAELASHLAVIAHVQISGLPGRHEPDGAQEIDTAGLLALLDKLGYGGWVGCEYTPRGDLLKGLAWARPYGIQPRG